MIGSYPNMPIFWATNQINPAHKAVTKFLLIQNIIGIFVKAVESQCRNASDGVTGLAWKERFAETVEGEAR